MTSLTLALAALAGVSARAEASSVYVSTSGVDAAGRGTAEAPFRTIQYAVTNETARDGLTINIAGGLYEESVTNSVYSSPVGHHAVKFVGSWKSDFSARDLRNARSRTTSTA